MGRKKIKIQPIQDNRNKQVTFTKRKNGLYKKLMELSILCNAKILMVMFNESGKLFQYVSSGTVDELLEHYVANCGKPHETRTNEDIFDQFFGEGGNAQESEDEDHSEEDPSNKSNKDKTLVSSYQPAAQLANAQAEQPFHDAGRDAPGNSALDGAEVPGSKRKRTALASTPAQLDNAFTPLPASTQQVVGQQPQMNLLQNMEFPPLDPTLLMQIINATGSQQRPGGSLAQAQAGPQPAPNPSAFDPSLQQFKGE